MSRGNSISICIQTTFYIFITWTWSSLDMFMFVIWSTQVAIMLIIRTFFKNKQTNKTPPKQQQHQNFQWSIKHLSGARINSYFLQFPVRRPFQHLVRLYSSTEINEIRVNNKMWLCEIKGDCTQIQKVKRPG